MKTAKRVLQIKKVKGNQFRIVKQTHREDEFVKNGDGFKASNGITLWSCSSPAWEEPDTLFVRGTYLTGDNRLVIIPADVQSKVLAAIREYNRKAGSGPITVRAEWAGYEVTITPTTLTVGCSEFSIKEFRQLVKMVDKATRGK